MQLSELLAMNINQASSKSCFVLFEAGLLDNKTLRQVCELADGKMRTLFVHPQLEHLVAVGPWLIQIAQTDDTIPNILEQQGVLRGIIWSDLLLPQLAEQLSWGCVVQSPEKTGTLLRFYTPDALQHLALRNDLSWHPELFNGIESWYISTEKQRWKVLFLPRSNNAPPCVKQNIVILDNELWSALSGDHEVTALLKVWQQQPQSSHFPICSQRAIVRKALDKAKQAGLVLPIDKKIYALHYLSGGNQSIHSEAMSLALNNVINNKITLAEALLQENE